MLKKKKLTSQELLTAYVRMFLEPKIKVFHRQFSASDNVAGNPTYIALFETNAPYVWFNSKYDPEQYIAWSISSKNTYHKVEAAYDDLLHEVLGRIVRCETYPRKVRLHHIPDSVEEMKLLVALNGG